MYPATDEEVANVGNAEQNGSAGEKMGYRREGSVHRAAGVDIPYVAEGFGVVR